MSVTPYDAVCIRRVLALLADCQDEPAQVAGRRLRALLKRRGNGGIRVEDSRSGGAAGSRPDPAFLPKYEDAESPAPRQAVRPAQAQRQRQPPRTGGGGGTVPDFITDGRGGIPEHGCPTWQGLGFDGPPASIPGD